MTVGELRKCLSYFNEEHELAFTFSDFYFQNVDDIAWNHTTGNVEIKLQEE